MFIIHLGTSGFPVGNNAVIQRMKLNFKGLKQAGCSPLIVNKHSNYKTNIAKRLSRFDGIPFILTSFNVSRPENFILRNFNKLSGYVGELVLLIKKHKKIEAAIVSGVTFSELVYYRILSKILGFKLVIEYVEFYSAIQNRRKIMNRMNDSMMDNYSFFFCDGIIVISEFLRNHTLSKRQNIPILKIPSVCDFEAFKPTEEITQQKALMYCGSVGYLTVINFVIDLYARLRELKLYTGRLLLVIGVGDKTSGLYQNMVDKIKNSVFSESIDLKTNIPHSELIKIYLGSELLIIPLRNERQDIAGFHHKVGEYCASVKPIISTKLGEINYYFEDGVSAILAEEFTIESYIEKLTLILPDAEKLESIAKEGNRVGESKLNYLHYGAQLREFMLNLNN